MFQTFFSEWASFLRDKKHIIFIVAIACVPIIYSGMFIWSFWSPYDHTEHLPVAVVNEDTGANLAGKQVNIGGDLVKALHHNKSFDWHFVSKKKASQAMKQNQYYMTITIPKDFSHQATTVLDKNPQRPVFEYQLNSGYNYIGSQISNSGAQTLEEKLKKQLTKTYTENMFSQINKLADGLKQASHGAGALDAGASKELKGLQTLKANLKTINTAGVALQQGAAQLTSGSNDLESGLSSVKAGTDQLYQTTKSSTSQVNALANGAKTLAAKTTELNQGVSALSSGNQSMIDQLSGQNLAQGLQDFSASMAKEYQGLASLNEQVKPLTNAQTEVEQLEAYISQSESILSDLQKFNPNEGQLTENQKAIMASIDKKLSALSIPQGQSMAWLSQLESLPKAVQQLTDGQKQLNDGFGQLTQNLQALTSGLTTLQKHLQQLPSATGALADGADQLSEHTQQLDEQWGTLVQNIGKINAAQTDLLKGSRDLHSHLVELQNGLAKVSHGQGQLANGTSALADGMQSLQNGSQTLSNRLNDAYHQTDNANLNGKHADVLSNPIKTKKSDGGIEKYGEGFTPYFLSLGLFVGALLLTVIYDVKTPAIRPKNGFAWGMGKYLFMAAVGVIQAIIADLIILFAIGLTVPNIWTFIGFSILTSLCFMACIQFFTTAFGDPGRFMVIIMLVLQLTTTGGTYPIELLPPVLYQFHHVLPMNYSLYGFRNIIKGGQSDLLMHNSLALVIFGVLFLAATVIYLMIHHNRQVKRTSATENSVSA
ncbi:hypothetical protein GCM10011391_28890 [Pullulanibacillus camelliae]|uniref:ABC-2 type transporter transmembrane domain-containing protein n=1 Tax=Pullulanibacillus camelliae TaxID=1707096 RepID=A0A8J3DXK4_9BACL|nr:YhgE/Pip domain-containing protein [Pullulanibacillus camelliae]GGE48319.1 hypothetical protein GCM10011391_28890 [Pullulanibacillus camelliae]